MTTGSLASLAKETALRGYEDRVPVLGAALAYYTAFAVAPLLLLTIAAAGIFAGHHARREVFDTLQGVLGPDATQAVRAVLKAAGHAQGTGTWATVLGVLTALLGASGVFQQLQDSMNIIWRVAPAPTMGWGRYLARRLLSFSMVLGILFAMLVSLALDTVVSALARFVPSGLPGGALFWHALDFGNSFLVLTLLFAAIYKIVPDVRLNWRDVWFGAAATSLLFGVGKLLIGLYIGRSGVASSYGAAGSFVLLLVWIYYSSQLILFGAEITRAHVARTGRPVRPKTGAQLVTGPAFIPPDPPSA